MVLSHYGGMVVGMSQNHRRSPAETVGKGRGVRGFLRCGTTGEQAALHGEGL